MSFNYAKTATTANKLLARFGKSWTIKSITPGAYDTDTGESAPTETDATANAVLLDYSNNGMTNAENSLIQVGDKKMLVAAQGLPFVIKAGDLCVSGAEQWRVINVQALKPADITVLYELQVRLA